MVYNPLNESITREIEVELYYTGLKNSATMSENDGVAKKVMLNGTKLNLRVTIPAKSRRWFVFTS